MEANGLMKATAGVTALGTVIGLSFAAWFAITGAIAEESRSRQLADDAQQIQRAADDVSFAIYQVTHSLDEIDAREHNQQARKGDATMRDQLERELEVLLRRQEQVLEAVELKSK